MTTRKKVIKEKIITPKIEPLIKEKIITPKIEPLIFEEESVKTVYDLNWIMLRRKIIILNHWIRITRIFIYTYSGLLVKSSLLHLKIKVISIWLWYKNEFNKYINGVKL